MGGENGSFCRPRYGKRRRATTATAASIALNEVPGIPTRQGAMRASIRPVHGLGSTVGWRALLQATDGRWQSPPGRQLPGLLHYRCGWRSRWTEPHISVTSQDYTNANHKADVPGPLNEVKKTVAIVFAEDNPRQKLALMQGVPFRARAPPASHRFAAAAIAGRSGRWGISMLAILASICRGIIVTVGHTHPGLRLFFKQSDGQRLTALHQFIKV